MTYNFNAKREQGEYYERWLDAHFSCDFIITPATRDEQRRGIDRHYKHKESGTEFTVEYKTDLTAARTHNAFIETVSVDMAHKPGWAYSSESFYLFHFVPGPNEDVVRCITFSSLRELLPTWIKDYPTRAIPNEGYHTIGVLVPIEDLEELAIYKGSVNPPGAPPPPPARSSRPTTNGANDDDNLC